jgi:hypothetical protein
VSAGVRQPERRVAQSRLVFLFACTGGLWLQFVPALAALATLAIHIESATPKYEEPASFELSVTLRNEGDAAVIVLPQSLRRTYTSLGGGAAHYSPYPGPPIRPWKDAFLLRPGESRTVTVRGMRDGDGVWNLEPGRYELSIRMSVTPDAVEASRSHVKHLGASIWHGDIQSSSIRVTYSPAPAA